MLNAKSCKQRKQVTVTTPFNCNCEIKSKVISLLDAIDLAGNEAMLTTDRIEGNDALRANYLAGLVLNLSNLIRDLINSEADHEFGLSRPIGIMELAEYRNDNELSSIGFPLRLTALLKELNLSQSELARRLDVTPQAVQRWCSGESFPRIENLRELSQVTGKPESWYLGVNQIQEQRGNQ